MRDNLNHPEVANVFAKLAANHNSRIPLGGLSTETRKAILALVPSAEYETSCLEFSRAKQQIAAATRDWIRENPGHPEAQALTASLAANHNSRVTLSLASRETREAILRRVPDALAAIATQPKRMTAELKALALRCFPAAIRAGKGQRQETRPPQPTGLPRQAKSRISFLEAIQASDEKCSACRNPFGIVYALFMGNRFVQNIPEHSHFGLTRAQGKRMNVATDGYDYPMCLACQLILGNNKSDHWESLPAFGEYSVQSQKERGYQVYQRRDGGGCITFEPFKGTESPPSTM